MVCCMSYRSAEDRRSGQRRPVMPAQAGIHGFPGLCFDGRRGYRPGVSLCYPHPRGDRMHRPWTSMALRLPSRRCVRAAPPLIRCLSRRRGTSAAAVSRRRPMHTISPTAYSPVGSRKTLSLLRPRRFDASPDITARADPESVGRFRNPNRSRPAMGPSCWWRGFSHRRPSSPTESRRS